MHKKKKTILASALFLSCLGIQAREWNLQQCLDYALANNLELKQKRITTLQNHEDVLQSRSALFPSVSFSTNQNMSYRPFSEMTINLTNGSMTSSSQSVSYNGSYGINANWTVWNGNRNRMDIKSNKLNEKQSELEEEKAANSLQEQVVQLYVQILYEKEAVKVCERIVENSTQQVERARVMFDVGSLSRADVMQLEAQLTQDKYSLVSTQNNVARYTLELKQLLELSPEDEFSVGGTDEVKNDVLSPIPSKDDVYRTARSSRPEIQTSLLGITSSELSIKRARTGYMPTLNLSAGFGTSNGSGQQNDFFQQIKRNFSSQIGLTLQVPIFDNLQTRTSIRKAKYNLQDSQIRLQTSEKQLYSQIENYWLQASTSQQQYVYAEKNRESRQTSYDLISEQFNLGLKNIIELTSGKNELLQAEQQCLESKYKTLLNSALLRFYSGARIEL